MSSFVITRRRYHTKNVASGGNHKKSVLNRAVDDFSDRTSRYDKALHKAFSTACCEAVIFFHQLVQLFLQIRSRLCYMLYDMLFLIAFNTALTAAQASGFPPYVVPWSPGTSECSAVFLFSTKAPTGTPQPSAFAHVMTSGCTP